MESRLTETPRLMEGSYSHNPTTFHNYVIALQGLEAACVRFDWWDLRYDVIFHELSAGKRDGILRSWSEDLAEDV